MANQENKYPEEERTEAELQELERHMRARVHKHMGITAAVLGLVAITVALARMRTMFGVSPLKALGIGATAVPWVLLIVAAGVVFSMGTARLIIGAEWLLGFMTGRKADKP